MPNDQPYWEPWIYGGFDPAAYCRTLRAQVEAGVYDFHTANAMWQNYRKSLKMLGLRDPGPCDLGGADAVPVFDGGYYDSGSYLGAPDAGYAVKGEEASRADRSDWAPVARPQIAFDPFSAAGGGDSGSVSYDPYVPGSSGFDTQRDGPASYGPAPAGSAPRFARQPWQQPRVEVLARGPDGTYHQVPYVPMPRPLPPPPPEGPPSPYEGVPVTGSFSIKD
jgi:hypothetical protein